MNELSQEILSLIRSKSRCLERLMEATQSFLREPMEKLVILSPSKDPSPNVLDTFNQEREGSIRALELYDRKINEMIPRLTSSDRTPAFMAEVKNELASNERLIAAIFSADEVVFARIREAQAQIAKLMNENRKSHEILSKFKSSQIRENGDEIDQTL